MTESKEAPVFDTVAFNSPPALSKATVAIVTSASLHHPAQDDFEPIDTGFRKLDAGESRPVWFYLTPGMSNQEDILHIEFFV